MWWCESREGMAKFGKGSVGTLLAVSVCAASATTAVGGLEPVCPPHANHHHDKHCICDQGYVCSPPPGRDELKRHCSDGYRVDRGPGDRYRTDMVWGFRHMKCPQCICTRAVTTAVAGPGDLDGDTMATQDDVIAQLGVSHGAAAEIVVILTMARSASTSVADSLGSHSCSTSFNEMLEKGERGLRAEAMPDSEEDCFFASIGHNVTCPDHGCNEPRPLARAKAARERWCSRAHAHPTSPWPSCGGVCAVAVKIHGEHWMSKGHRRDALSELLSYNGSTVVVSERLDVAAQECSWRYARHLLPRHAPNLFHGGDHAAQEKWANEHCSSPATPAYQRAHDEWYAWARRRLRELGKPYLEMTFEEYVGDVEATEAKLHAHAGLSPQPFRGACQDGCNCDHRSLGL